MILRANYKGFEDVTSETAIEYLSKVLNNASIAQWKCNELVPH